MVNIAITGVQITGDIGGLGISRFHWQTPGGTTPVPADCNSATAAIHAFYDAVKGTLPTNTRYDVEPIALVIDAVSAIPVANVAASDGTATVVGTNDGNYAAGVGCRINWKSSTVHGRRFMRGATMLVPLGPGSYTNTGAVAAAALTTISGAAFDLMTAFTTAGLELVIYGRPPKGTTSGGHVGSITAVICGPTPGGLRSRRS